MLVGELLEAASGLPPEARINVYVDQELTLSCDEWSGKATACLSEYFEVKELVAESAWEGEGKVSCLTIVTGRAV